MGSGPSARTGPSSEPGTHMSGVLPLQRSLVLLLVEQGRILGLQPRDGLGPIVLGVKMMSRTAAWPELRLYLGEAERGEQHNGP